MLLNYAIWVHCYSCVIIRTELPSVRYIFQSNEAGASAKTYSCLLTRCRHRCELSVADREWKDGDRSTTYEVIQSNRDDDFMQTTNVDWMQKSKTKAKIWHNGCQFRVGGCSYHISTQADWIAKALRCSKTKKQMRLKRQQKYGRTNKASEHHSEIQTPAHTHALRWIALFRRSAEVKDFSLTFFNVYNFISCTVHESSIERANQKCWKIVILHREVIAYFYVRFQQSAVQMAEHWAV